MNRKKNGFWNLQKGESIVSLSDQNKPRISTPVSDRRTNLLWEQFLALRLAWLCLWVWRSPGALGRSFKMKCVPSGNSGLIARVQGSISFAVVKH